MSDDSKANAPRKKSKLLVIILVLILLAGGGGGYFFFMKRPSTAKADTKKSKKAEAAEEDKNEDEEEDDQAAEGKKGKSSKEGKGKSNIEALMLPKDEEVKQVIELQPFILNLADKDENRFLRLTLGLGVGDDSSEKPDTVFITRARNAVLAVLMTKTSSDALSAEGKMILRKELLEAIQAAAHEPPVIAIYITELIVQR